MRTRRWTGRWRVPRRGVVRGVGEVPARRTAAVAACAMDGAWTKPPPAGSSTSGEGAPSGGWATGVGGAQTVEVLDGAVGAEGDTGRLGGAQLGESAGGEAGDPGVEPVRSDVEASPSSSAARSGSSCAAASAAATVSA